MLVTPEDIIASKVLRIRGFDVGAGTAPAERSSLVAPTLNALYAEHGGSVARWTLRLGGPDFEAADAVQEVFAIAAEQLRYFRGESKIATWLYGITENVVRQTRRRERMRRWFLGREREREVPASDSGPSEAIERRQLNALVYRALDRLREPYRSALILFEIEELSGEEIAELKRCKVATVWVWLHRARAQFLAQLTTLTEKP
jgi:RNA polymerase sigma-70 factor (ECF subfamily)